MITAIKRRLMHVRRFWKRNERWISPAAFLVGFLWDSITLQRVDLLFENIVLAWNLIAAVLLILVINAYGSGRLRFRIVDRIAPFLPTLLQFTFGSLFSAFSIFYIRSSAFWVSWPFLLLIALLIIANEHYRHRYIRLTFQISVYFVALFSYMVIILPVVAGKMGPLVFVASGFLALAMIFGVTLIVRRIAPDRFARNKRLLAASIGSIFLAFNVLYFTDLIPPVPLSLKESGVYHTLTRVNQDGYLYRVTYEPEPWYLFFKDQSDTFHWQKGGRIYSYSSVFAPTDLDTTIFHRWSRFSETEDTWVEITRVALPLSGGRDGGYRGFSFITRVTPGKWRVDVVTGTNQTLGRRTFEVVETTQPPNLETIYR